MKLKKLAIKFLTMALSLLTLFQVGCGSQKKIYYEFDSFEEMENFLLEEAIYGYNQLYLEESHTKFCVLPNEYKLFFKLYDYLYETNQVDANSSDLNTAGDFRIRDYNKLWSSAKLENLKVKPLKHIGYQSGCETLFPELEIYLVDKTSEERIKRIDLCTNTPSLFDYSTEPVEFCDCLIYLFGLEESCGIKHKQYNSGEFTFEHDCEPRKFRIMWNGEDHTNCFNFNNIYPNYNSNYNYIFYNLLKYLYSANCENCLNLINIPTELLNKWGLEYIHNDIHLYTLDPTNAPEGNARIVKIH